MTNTLNYKSVVPAVPRQATRRVRQRAWAEMPVQLWWKSAVAVFLIAIAIASVDIKDELRHRSLMREGTPAEALIVEVQGTSRAGFAVLREESIAVKLRWRLPNQGEETISTFLPAAPGYAKVGETIKVRIDPNDHSNWAEDTEVRPWWWVLAIPLFLLLPTTVVLLLVAFWRHRQMIVLWRDGRRADGIVVEARHAAWSPKSRLCRIMYADGRDRRIFKLLYPSYAGVPRRDDTIPLVADPRNPARCVAADPYLSIPMATPSSAGDAET